MSRYDFHWHRGLVPDEIVLKLLKKAMVKHQDTNRFLLDGFPRAAPWILLTSLDFECFYGLGESKRLGYGTGRARPSHLSTPTVTIFLT